MALKRYIFEVIMCILKRIECVNSPPFNMKAICKVSTICTQGLKFEFVVCYSYSRAAINRASYEMANTWLGTVLEGGGSCICPILHPINHNTAHITLDHIPGASIAGYQQDVGGPHHLYYASC